MADSGVNALTVTGPSNMRAFMGAVRYFVGRSKFDLTVNEFLPISGEKKIQDSGICEIISCISSLLAYIFWIVITICEFYPLWLA